MFKRKKNKVFVAMSGGVDSSVAALLLKKRGYEVVGVFIKCFNLDGCSEKDAEDARRVASYLDIPFYVFDFEKEYKKEVVDYLIDGYKKGITPNPDVICNQQIKFGLFLEKAKSLGADYIATGHYVIKKNQKGTYCLYISKDKNKDQTYFLWTLTQKQLKYCIFPIGLYLKSEVRKIAEKYNLPTAFKKDSQGICFLGKISLFDFLSQYLPLREGEIVSEKDEKLGIHKGVWFYTIGQRHLGVSLGMPVYVADKDLENNRLIVVRSAYHPLLYKKEIDLEEVNYFQPLKRKKIRVFVRVRYRQPLNEADLYKISLKKAKVVFKKPVKFVAPGQSAVFYSLKEKMLGGGVIS